MYRTPLIFPGHTFTYYDDGNIDTRQVTGESTTTFAYTGDLMDGATGQDNFTLDWDDNGRMISGVDTTLTYSWDGKLRKAVKGGPDDYVEFVYTPDGSRISKNVTESGSVSSSHKYIVDPVGKIPVVLLILDTQNNNDVLKTYVHANGQVLKQYDGDYTAPAYFYLHDRLGSVRLVIDSDGNVKKTYLYEPFGSEVSSETTETVGNPYRFAGYLWDGEVGEYYCTGSA